MRVRRTPRIRSPTIRTLSTWRGLLPIAPIPVWCALPDASYTAASDDLQLYTDGSPTDLSRNAQTYYVPKPSATDLTDQRQYYRYQILRRRQPGGACGMGQHEQHRSSESGHTGTASRRRESVGTTAAALAPQARNASRHVYTVPAGGTTRGHRHQRRRSDTTRNPNIYVKCGAERPPPIFASHLSTAQSDSSGQSGATHETLTINNPTSRAAYHIGVFNSGSSAITNMTVDGDRQRCTNQESRVGLHGTAPPTTAGKTAPMSAPAGTPPPACAPWLRKSRTTPIGTSTTAPA